jgi:hypothetical protein
MTFLQQGRFNSLFSLTLIFLLGAALRIANLGGQPLWIDEAFSYIAVKSPDLLAALSHDVHPPLYFLMLKGWSGLAGVSEFSLRYPSLLLGVLSIALIYKLAQEIFILRGEGQNRVIPILAALMLAISEMGFYVGQETRSYSLHIVLALVSMWAFLRWSRTSQPNWAVIWVISTAALVYTHYLGAWVGVVQGLYVLFFLRGRKRLEAFGLLSLSAALFSLWLFTVVLPYQTQKADSDATMDASTLETLVSYARQYLTEQWSLMLGLFVLGLVLVRENNTVRLRPFKASALLLLWIIVPVLLTFIGNFRFSILTTYRVSQIMIPLAIVWAVGIAQFRPPVRLFLVAVVVLYSVVNVDFGRIYFPWDNYARQSSEFAVKGDLALMDFKGVDFSMEYYLDHQLPADTRVISLRNYTVWTPERLYDDLIPALQTHETVWLSRWNDQPLAFDLLTSNGFTETMHRQLSYQGITVDTYRFDRLGDITPIATYENGMVLLNARLSGTHLDLWWKAAEPMERDFTVSAFVLDSTGALVAQHDSQPMLNERPTSSWRTNEIIYDPKPIPGLATFTYHKTYGDQMGVKVYRLRPDGIRDIPLENGEPYAIIDP